MEQDAAEGLPDTLRVYSRRFWLLGTFCFLAVLQSAAWNFYRCCSRCSVTSGFLNATPTKPPVDCLLYLAVTTATSLEAL